MSIEDPFNNISPFATEKESAIEIVSADEYLQKNLDQPTQEISVGELIERHHKEEQPIKSKLRNDLTSRWLKESSDNGLIEELGYFPLKYKDNGMIDDDDFDKVYFAQDHEKYYVHTLPIWSEDGEVKGYICFREQKQQDEEKKEIQKEIGIKYEKEINNEWLLVEQERDKILQQKVREGKMVYLGELTDNEYISLRKKGIPAGNFEKVVLFDENQAYINDRHKVYAYILKQN